MRRATTLLAAVSLLAGTFAGTAPARASGAGFDAGARAAHLRQATPAAPPVRALAFGDCGSALFEDPDEGLLVDIDLSEGAADCDGFVGVAVTTHDSWLTSHLDYYAVGLDTDGSSATGCQGFEFSVITIVDGGELVSAVFSESASCELGDIVAPAGASEDGTTIAAVWDGVDIGSPSSFRFLTETRAVGASESDFAPDTPDIALPRLTVTSSEPPPGPAPVPAARSIAPACTFAGGFEDGFADAPAANGHETAIDCIVYWQITTGVRVGVYNPSGGVTREQMASFIGRLILRSGGSLPPSPPDAFGDDDASSHEGAINKLAAVGIVTGRSSGGFARAGVTRAQMASFIVRALEHVLGGPLGGTSTPNYFTDDGGDVHEENINLAASAGITGGIGGRSYGPLQPVRRDQMGSFLARALAELVDRGTSSIPARPAKCALDPAVEATDARCQPCPYNAGISIGNPACQAPAPPPPPPPPPPAGPACHPSYPDFCIPPPPPDLDCGDFSQKRFRSTGSDPHRLDGDGDGIACET